MEVSKLGRKSIYTIVTLVSAYITLQLIADVTVAKMVTLFGISLPAGSLLYALTFTWRDMVHKRLGRDWARACILLAAFCNVGMAVWFVSTIQMPAAGFWQNQEAYAMVLGIMPRIVIASILAEVISEWTDTEIYHRVRDKFTGKWQFMRVVVSNGIAAPVDAVAFGLMAFAGTMPLPALVSILWGGAVFKLIIGYVVIPAVYLIKDEELKLVPVPSVCRR